MFKFLTQLLDTEGFPARWDCGAAWSDAPSLGWLHIGSDLAIWFAYFAIPCILLYFVLRRPTVPFRLIFLLFIAFILSCGSTHLMEAIIFWWPAYRLSGAIKLLTALVSWATIFSLVRVAPEVLAMRSPQELEREIEARKQAETALQHANELLEQRVHERTAELLRANEQLHREVAERRRQEARVRESEQRLSFALAAGDLGQWELNLTDLTACRTLHHDQIFGYEQLLPEWTFSIFLEHVVAEDRAAVDDSFQAAMRAGGSWENFCRIRRADGATRWIWLKARPQANALGQTERLLGVIRDVTVFKEQEHKLRELAANLSDADRRKDEFLATLSHELRNPLAPIRTGLQIMRLAGDNKAIVNQSHAMMERQVSHLVRLVDDLMDVSRITRDKIALRFAEADLSEAIHNAIETSQPLIDSSQLTLTINLPTDPLPVRADIARLGQVFANLLNNAAKYTEPGGRIALRARIEADQVRVSVRDTGIGIPPEMLDRVFDMFTQVDHSLQRSRGGLGVGLTLVKRLVELHGGNVIVRSEGVDRGSEFIVSMPLLEARSQSA